MILFKKKKSLNIHKLDIYLEIFNSRRYLSSYFKKISNHNTTIDIKGNEISGFIKIYYKDILVVDLCLDNRPLVGWCKIPYNPCDEIIDEINIEIDSCVHNAKEYIERLNQERLEKIIYAKHILRAK